MGNILKSVLVFILVGSIILAVWKIWGVTGQLDVLFGMIWDGVFGVLDAGATVLSKAINALLNM